MHDVKEQYDRWHDERNVNAEVDAPCHQLVRATGRVWREEGQPINQLTVLSRTAPENTHARHWPG